MKILCEYYNHGVLQRDESDLCCASIAFTCARPGALLSIDLHEGDLFTPAGKGVTADENGCGFLVPDHLKTGGPYELRIREEGSDSAAVLQDVYVGDVYLLAGQSNMAGSGKLSQADPPSERVRCFGFEDCWKVAHSPLHVFRSAVCPIYRKFMGVPADPDTRQDNSAFLGVGPGHAFALDLLRRTDVPQGVIAGAVGGSCLQEWFPPQKDPLAEDANYYTALLRRFRLSGGKARGLFWFQGEADTRSERFSSYSEKTSLLFEAFQRDFASGGGLFPIVFAQLGVMVHDSRPIGWPSVREQQRRLQDWEKRIAFVPTLDLDVLDGIHLSAEAAQETGRRAAAVMEGLILDRREVLYPDPVEIVSSWDPEIKAPTVIVTFRNLQGNLRSSGKKALGFLLHDRETLLPLPVLSFTELAGNKAIIHLSRSEYGIEPAEKYLLSYGGSCNVPVNITDSAFRPLPGFGPLPIRDGKKNPSVEK